MDREEVLKSLKTLAGKSQERLQLIQEQIMAHIERFTSKLTKEIEFFKQIPEDTIEHTLNNLKNQLREKFDKIEELKKFVFNFEVKDSLEAVDPLLKIPERTPVETLIHLPPKRKSNTSMDYRCPFCDSVSEEIKKFKSHIVKHGKIFQYNCPHCDNQVKTDTAGLLATHLFAQHNQTKSVRIKQGITREVRYYQCIFTKKKYQFPLELATYIRFNPNYQSYEEMTLSYMVHKRIRI